MNIKSTLGVMTGLIGCLGSMPTHAATIVVSNPLDFIGPPQSLVQRCLSQMPANQCTLRDASKLSTQLAGPDTILLPATTYSLSLGELNFFGDVTLQGAGPQTTIIKNAANKKNRILNFVQADKVTLKNLTVRGGVLDAFEAPPEGVYDGGAGVRAAGVSDLTIDNTRIMNNTIIMKAGPWPDGFVGKDQSAASGLYVEGGVTLVNGSWVSQNKIVHEDKNEPALIPGASSIYVASGNAQQEILIRNSFVENNTAEYIAGTSDYFGIHLESASVIIARSFFRKNNMETTVATLDGEGTISVEESHFDQAGVCCGAVSMKPLKGLLTLTGNTFDEAPLSLFNDSIAGVRTDSLRPNTIVNNTFKSTTAAGLISFATDKAMAIYYSGSFDSVRPTMVVHNTVDFTAPVIANPALHGNMSAVYVESPATFQNNIIHAHPEPGFAFKLFPCYVHETPNKAFPLTSLGGNLIVSPDVMPTTEDAFNCASNANDLESADPLLDDLKGNGGWTPTMALLPGSPALSTALEPIGTSVPLDQRGKKRPQGTGRDIGAFESEGGPIPNFK